MITVKNINGSPEFIPKTKFGSHSDESSFYFFETQEEIDLHKAKIESEGSPTVEPKDPIEELKLQISELETKLSTNTKNIETIATAVDVEIETVVK